MKRSFATILLVLTAALTACGSPPTDTGNTDPDQTAATSEEIAYQTCTALRQCGKSIVSTCETEMTAYLNGLPEPQRSLCMDEIAATVASGDNHCHDQGRNFVPDCTNMPSLKTNDN